MANEWNTHLDSLKDRLSELNSTIDVIKNKVEKRPGLDAATQGIAGLISSDNDKSLSQYPVLLSNVLSDSAIGAIMLNAEGKFMMFNFTAQRILGIAYVSRMSGAGDIDRERQEEPASFLKPDDSYFEEGELPWKRVLNGIQVNNFRLKVKKDAISDVRWINISATPFTDVHQAVSGGIVFLFDFTDEVNLETSINSLCGVIAGQISQVGNSQRELEQLANQLAQTGIQKILLEKGIVSPEARAPEPVAVAPVPDLSQRARFQPEAAREALEERKKSEETPDALMDKLANAAHEPESAKAQESQIQNEESDEDIAPWPEEADGEDFNRPLWEEYGKGEEETAQAWTKNLDAVVSEVIEASRDAQPAAPAAQSVIIEDEEDEDEDEDEDEEPETEIDQVEEVHAFDEESDTQIVSQESLPEIQEIQDIQDIHEVHEVHEVHEIHEVEEIDEHHEIQDAEEVDESVILDDPNQVHEVESLEEEIEDTQIETIEAHEASEEIALEEHSAHEHSHEAEEVEVENEAVEVELENINHESEFDEFEPIDQILSFDDPPHVVGSEESHESAELSELNELDNSFEAAAQSSEAPHSVSSPFESPTFANQSFENQSFEPMQMQPQPEMQPQMNSAPPPAPMPPPEMPAGLMQQMQQQQTQIPEAKLSENEPEDFSNIGSLVKPSLKDTLLGGKKKRNTSASMHRIKAMGGTTELGDETENEPTVVDYGNEDGDADLNIKKVLVVDDIPVNQKLLLLHLRRLGYDADVASNGQEALDALANKEYELILMDCDMPVMNGFEAAARIRSNESYSHTRIPIIALTSYDREGDRERCIAAGMDDYITKGASRKELKEAIKRSVYSAREKGQAHSGEFNLDDIQADIAPLDIKAMLKLYGKEEVEEISRLFLSNMGTYIECMQLAIDEKDADSVVHFANAVKGPCAALGMKLMTRLTTDIISYSEAKDWTQVRVKYMRLKAVFVQTREELKKVCPDDSLLAK